MKRVTLYRLLRLVAAMLVCVWGWFIIGLYRAMVLGPSWRALALDFWAAATAVLLPALLPFIGLTWKKVVRGCLLIVMISLLATEMWFLAEDVAVRRHFGAAPQHEVRYNRAWPFGHRGQNVVCYTRSAGWYVED